MDTARRNRIHNPRRWVGLACLGLVGLLLLAVAIAGVREIAHATSARSTTVEGTIASYVYLNNCQPRFCYISDILQPLRDYQLTLHTEVSTEAFVVHQYDFNALPDLSAMVGAAATLAIGTDTMWSDAAQRDIRDVLAISVGGVTYRTPYAAHPRLRYWDWIATGLAWMGPLVLYAGLVFVVALPNRRSPSRRRTDVEDRWGAYALVSFCAWFVIGLVGGYLLRVRAGSVEFWLLLYAYAAIPPVLATALNRLEGSVGLLLPRTLASEVVDYRTTFFSPADAYRIAIALGVTLIVEVGMVLTVREALMNLLA